jgi:hypothetical protein
MQSDSHIFAYCDLLPINGILFQKVQMASGKYGLFFAGFRLPNMALTPSFTVVFLKTFGDFLDVLVLDHQKQHVFDDDFFLLVRHLKNLQEQIKRMPPPPVRHLAALYPPPRQRLVRPVFKQPPKSDLLKRMVQAISECSERLILKPNTPRRRRLCLAPARVNS